MAEIEVSRTLIGDVREFIAQKWKNNKCEICDTDKWKVLPDAIAYARLDLANGDGKGVDPALFPYSILYLQVSCLNCGNLRLVDKGIFEDWRAEQKEATTKSSS
jgi:hypothetical protein